MKKYKVRITRKQSIEIEVQANRIKGYMNIYGPGIIIDARNGKYDSEFEKVNVVIDADFRRVK